MKRMGLVISSSNRVEQPRFINLQTPQGKTTNLGVVQKNFGGARFSTPMISRLSGSANCGCGK